MLDYGCGDGTLLRRVSEHFECYGFDPSALARSRARLAAPDAVVLEEWQSLPVESFDVVVSVRALEDLPRPLVTLQGLAERLAPAGLFLLVVANPGGLGRQLKGDAWFQRHGRRRQGIRSRGEWMTMVKRAGLEVLWVSGDGLWDAPYIGIVPAALQRVVCGIPGALELISPFKRPLLPAALGECLIVAAEKPTAAG